MSLGCFRVSLKMNNRDVFGKKKSLDLTFHRRDNPYEKNYFIRKKNQYLKKKEMK